jgi:hypothetical protein
MFAAVSLPINQGTTAGKIGPNAPSPFSPPLLFAAMSLSTFGITLSIDRLSTK